MTALQFREDPQTLPFEPSKRLKAPARRGSSGWWPRAPWVILTSPCQAKHRLSRQLIIGALCLVSACAPAPSPSHGVTVTGTHTSPAHPTERGPSASVTGHLPLPGVIALEAATDGVWYIRSDRVGGWIGRATPSSLGDEVRVGPAPVAVASSGPAIYVAEGRPDETKQPRVDVVELLDPNTLKIRASAPLEGLITDMIVTGGMVWVTTADGTLHVFDGRDLSPLAETHFEGSGPSHLATWDGSVWVLTGEIDESGGQRTLLHRIARHSYAVGSTSTIPGTAGVSALSGGTTGWAATGSSAPGAGRIYRLDSAGSPTASFGVPTAAAMVALADSLWWASADGQVGMIRPSAANQLQPLRIGSGATDIVFSAGLIWVASDDLVTLRPSP